LLRFLSPASVCVCVCVLSDFDIDMFYIQLYTDILWP